MPCQVRPPKCKQFPCGEQEQEQPVNTAPPTLPELRIHKFSLRTCGQQQSRDTLRTSILWMSHDHPVNCPYQTGHEMMCRSGISVEQWAFSLPRDTQTNWGSDAWGQRLDTNAAVLPDSPALIIAPRLNSKASKSGSSLSIVCAASRISNSILKS